RPGARADPRHKTHVIATAAEPAMSLLAAIFSETYAPGGCKARCPWHRPGNSRAPGGAAAPEVVNGRHYTVARRGAGRGQWHVAVAPRARWTARAPRARPPARRPWGQRAGPGAATRTRAPRSSATASGR